MGSTPIGISASRGAAILGLSKYKSPLVAWLEIMEARKPGFCQLKGYTKPERIDPFAEPLNPKTAPLRWGLAFEGAICDIVGNVENREKAFQHPDHDFITCHIDGLKNGRLQENKTAFDMAYKMGWGELGSDMIPIDYAVQVQHQMMCSGIKNTDVNVLVFPRSQAEFEKLGYMVDLDDNCLYKGSKAYSKLDFVNWLSILGYFHHYHVESSPSAQKDILERYFYFWNENVLKEIEPPVKGYDDIKWLIPSPEGEIEADKEMSELWSELVDIEAEADSGKKRVEQIKDEFAKYVQYKTPKDSAEKGKLNCYYGSRKLFSISRPKPGIKVSGSTVDKIKDNDPELYAEMKKTSFADILPELNSCMTDKQLESFNELSDEQQKLYGELGEKVQKFTGKLKLTKLLDKDNIMKAVEKSKPELYQKLRDCRLVIDTDPSSRLTISKPKKD